MIVEFMGLPGAGKSTLAAMLLREMRRRERGWMSGSKAQIRCLRRRNDGLALSVAKRLPYGLWEPWAGLRRALGEVHEFSSDHPGWMRIVFETVESCDAPLSWRRCVLFALLMRVAERQLFNHHLSSVETAVVEEGLAHGAFTLFNICVQDKPQNASPASYADSMPAPNTVVWVDASPETCAARLKQRPELPLLWQGYEPDDVLKRLYVGRDVLECVAETLDRRGVVVRKVHNPDGGFTSQDAWASWIEPLVEAMKTSSGSV